MSPLHDREQKSNLSDPAQLKQLLVVVTNKEWLALVCIIFLVAILILWSLVGSLPISIHGKGIIMNQTGHLFNIQAKIGGTLTNVYVKSGDYVTEGQLIAEISDPQWVLMLKKVETKINNKHSLIDDYIKNQNNEWKRNLKAKMESLEKLKEQKNDQEKELEKTQKIYKEGLINFSVLQTSKNAFSTKQSEIAAMAAEIEQLNDYLANGYVTAELQTAKQELFLLLEEMELLELQKPYYKIYSPSQGYILELLMNVGDQVKPGFDIVWMEYASSQSESFLIFGYFSVENGKQITKDTQMQIALSTINPQEYGYLEGRVKEVSEYAVSKESLTKIIHNQEIINYLTSDSLAVIQVIIEPVIDPLTKTTQWTSGVQPPIKITTGTMASIHAVIKRIHPIYYFLPVSSLQMTDQSPKIPQRVQRVS